MSGDSVADDPPIAPRQPKPDRAGKGRTNKKHRRVPEYVWVIAGAAIVAGVLLPGPPWWWPSSVSTSPSVPFSGGCASHQVYAENLGSAKIVIRAGPNPQSAQVGEISSVASIAVDGWTYGRSAPATAGVTPLESMIWFHLTDNAGWVSFASVRLYPTEYDPSGGDPRQIHAVASVNCEGSAG